MRLLMAGRMGFQAVRRAAASRRSSICCGLPSKIAPTILNDRTCHDGLPVFMVRCARRDNAALSAANAS